MSKEVKEVKVNAVKPNENDIVIYNILANADKPMTVAEVSAAAGKKFVAGNFVSALKKNYIAKGEDVEVVRKGKRAVTVYEVGRATLDGKDADGKPYKYTDGEARVMGAVKESGLETFTLAELNAATNNNFVSGNINSLVKKGNLVKGAEKVTVEVDVVGMVGTYTIGTKNPNA